MWKFELYFIVLKIFRQLGKNYSFKKQSYKKILKQVV
jgi:hypothetical protein